MRLPVARLAAITGLIVSLLGTPASAALLVEGLEGPVTARELAAFKQHMNALAPFPSNLDNSFVYRRSGADLQGMGLVYEFSGEVELLDRAIFYADHMLSQRNHPVTGRLIFTGKRERCWPNTRQTDPDAGYCGSEQGEIVGHLAYVAKLIIRTRTLWERPVPIGDPHGFGATYLQRARTYLREGSRTIDELLTPWFVRADNKRFYWPDSDLFAAMGESYARNRNRGIPWNQQLMMTAGLQNIAEALELLGEDPARVASYDGLVKTSLDWFFSEAVKYQAGGRDCWKWSYAVNDPTLRYIEDTGHAAFDVFGLDRSFGRSRYGISRATMVAFADTLLQVIARPGGIFSEKVDGSTTETRSWLGGPFLLLSRYRPDVYKVIAAPGLAEVSNRPDMIARILWAKNLAAGGGAPDGGLAADALPPADGAGDLFTAPAVDAGAPADATAERGGATAPDAATRSDLAPAPVEEEPGTPAPTRPTEAAGCACATGPTGASSPFPLSLVMAVAIVTRARRR